MLRLLLRVRDTVNKLL